MDLLHLFVLGILQGLTEFLPISSSAHLILLPRVMAWQDQGLVYDVAAHVGSLAAVMIYFKKDIRTVTGSWFRSLSTGEQTQDSRMFWYIALSTIPIAAAGYLLYGIISTYLRNPVVIAIASIVFGFLLWWSDVYGKRLRQIDQITFKDAIIIGIAQAIAIIPGTSRSGITMTAGLMLGLDRRTAARFSFFLAVPTIMLAGGYEGYRYFIEGALTDWGAFFTVAIVSGVSAWLAIHYFLKFLEQTGMLPYVIYRVLLGVVLLFFYM